MAQNTFHVQRGNLTIKYSKYYRIDEIQQHKLVRSLEMARTCLDAAIKELDRVREDNIVLLPRVTKKILTFHFFQNIGYEKSIDSKCLADIRQIKQRFNSILVGLTAPVTIADAYGTRVGQAREKTRESFQNKMNERALNNTYLKDMGIAESPQFSFQEYREEILKSVRAAEDDLKEARGFVALKSQTSDRLKQANQLDDWHSGKLASRSEVPSLAVELSSDELGSIHLNFMRLLRTGDEPPGLLSVAQTIIHEASHKFIGTHDFAYAGENRYSNLDTRQAMLNADSYAFAVCSLARQRLFKDGNHLKFKEYLAS